MIGLRDIIMLAGYGAKLDWDVGRSDYSAHAALPVFFSRDSARLTRVCKYVQLARVTVELNHFVNQSINRTSHEGYTFRSYHPSNKCLLHQPLARIKRKQCQWRRNLNMAPSNVRIQTSRPATVYTFSIRTQCRHPVSL